MKYLVKLAAQSSSTCSLRMQVADVHGSDRVWEWKMSQTTWQVCYCKLGNHRNLQRLQHHCISHHRDKNREDARALDMVGYLGEWRSTAPVLLLENCFWPDLGCLEVRLRVLV